jgi:hypothetical protein
MRAGAGVIVVGSLLAGLVHPAAIQAQGRLVEPANASDVVRAAGFGPNAIRQVVRALSASAADAEVIGLPELPPQASCEASRMQGRTDAGAAHGAGGWFGGGVASGVGLGLIGTGIITGVAALGNPQPREAPVDVDASCYREGYSGRARGKNVTSSLLGGLVGTAVWVVIVASGS